MGKEYLWSPAPESLADTNLAQLMREEGFETYDQVHRWSVEQPADFVKHTIQTLNIKLLRPYKTLLDLSEGPTHAHWLQGAQLNIAESCFQGSADRPAIITRRLNGSIERISVGELDRLSNRVANGLMEHGLKRGDSIAIDMPMTAETVAIYLGIVKAGCVVVSIADALAEPEVEKRFKISDAKVVFTQDVINRGDKTLEMYRKVCNANAPPAIVLPERSKVAVDLREGDLTWSNFISDNDKFQAVACASEDPTNIVFSSGTTGEPKGIILNHTTPIKYGADGRYHQDIHKNDVVAWPTNFGWMMGPWLVYATLLNQGTIALYEGHPSEPGFGQFVQDAKVNVLGLVPSLVNAWRNSNAMTGYDWSYLRAFSSSGEASNPIDYAWLMQLNQPFGITKPVIEYCGGTEIGGGYVTSTMIVGNNPSQFNARALGIDFVVLDEEGNPTKMGEEGEIYLTTPEALGLSTKLLNKDHEQVYFEGCPTLPNSNMPLRRHGDILRIENGGRFVHAGRADDMMKLAASTNSSTDIERAVKPVEGVSETAAIAVPPRGGGPNRLVIYVVMQPGIPGRADALRSEMQQLISTQINPQHRVYEVVIVDSLPRNAANKVMRRELRSEYIAREAAGIKTILDSKPT